MGEMNGFHPSSRVDVKPQYAAQPKPDAPAAPAAKRELTDKEISAVQLTAQSIFLGVATAFAAYGFGIGFFGWLGIFMLTWLVPSDFKYRA